MLIQLPKYPYYIVIIPKYITQRPIRKTMHQQPFMNRGNNQLVDWFYRHLLHKVKYGFMFFKLHAPTRKYIDKIDPRIVWRKLVHKVNPSRMLKKVPLKTFP